MSGVRGTLVSLPPLQCVRVARTRSVAEVALAEALAEGEAR